MKNPFSLRRYQSQIFSPLAARRTPGLLDRLPAAAAPIAVTLAGGLGIIVLFAALLGQGAREPDMAAAASVKGDIASAPIQAASATAGSKPVAADIPAATKASELTAASLDGEAGPSAGADTPATANFADGSVAVTEPQGDNPAAQVVAVAENPDEVLALEAAQRREVEADIGTPSDEKTAGIPPVSPPKVAAMATKWVNMRAGPSDDAEVLMVVPALAEIKAESGCNWCAVTYDGHQGYIYKNFLSYE